MRDKDDRWSHRTPPWWPAGEPWPPPVGSRYEYRLGGMRGRFFRRIGCGIVLFLLLFVAGSAVLTWLIGAASGAVQIPPATFHVLRLAGGLIALLILAGFFFTVRTLRRTALPFGDLLDAAGRIEAGDYSARVDERGPREMRSLARAFNSMAEGLQTSDEQRRRLLADVTHELRTPITVIQGNLEGLLDGIYPADAGHIEPILEETRTLSRIIDDLRTLSLAESGALKLELEPAEIGELLQDVAASFAAQAEPAGVILRVDAQPGLPSILVDPTRIREVVSNLVVNALRYTPPGGGIDLRAWQDGERIYVSVADTGAGIAPEDLPHIFDRFTKSSDSRGTGLGLAISKSLVAAHKGEISAQSEVDRGTTITFWLPALTP